MEQEQDPMQVALSTHVIMDIVMSHLKERDLLSCRLASKFWNKAASSILRKRSTMMKNISDETHLIQLEKCMETNPDFPFAGLKLSKPWKLNSDPAMEFFQNYGDRFTCLCLNISWTRRMHDLVPFIDHLPRLSILEMGSCSQPSVDPDAPQEDGKILNLPSVRTIRISSSNFNLDEEVLCEVLLAASPSLQIECLDTTSKILRVLQRAGKLRAVSFMKFNKDEEEDLEMNQLLSTESPSLTKLDLNYLGCLSPEGMSEILRSSQDTLKELSMDAPVESMIHAGKISCEMFPVFSKLTSLNLCVEIGTLYGSLFRGRQGYKFPALKELQLSFTYKASGKKSTCVSDGLFIIPSLTTIDLEGYASGDAIKKLARSFPNVVEMRLNYDFYCGNVIMWGENPREMWNVREFKCLEKLRIWNYAVERPNKHYIGMDRFLTGIPHRICEKLRKKNRLDLIDSPSNELLRFHPSILQLENLKQLMVCVKPGNGFEEMLPEDVPFISMVSVWYALEMVPNLQAKFVYEHPSPMSHDTIRDKAVLEAAFKHVYPSVKLEPFWY